MSRTNRRVASRRWVISVVASLVVWVWWLDPTFPWGVLYTTSPLLFVGPYVVGIARIDGRGWVVPATLLPVVAFSASLLTYVFVSTGVAMGESPLSPFHPYVIVFSVGWTVLAIISYCVGLALEWMWASAREVR